jgi:hypothetical protein
VNVCRNGFSQLVGMENSKSNKCLKNIGAGEALRFKFYDRFFVFVSKAYRNGQFLCWTFYWTRFIGADEGFKRFPAADEVAAFVLFHYC